MRFFLDIAPITPAEEFAMQIEEALPWMSIGIAVLFAIGALWFVYLNKKNKK